MIDSVSDMSQPLALVHKAPIVIREIKGLRDQRTESPRIMCEFGLIPSVLKGQNPSGLINSHTSVLSSDCDTHRYQKDTATRASHQTLHINLHRCCLESVVKSDGNRAWKSTIGTAGSMRLRIGQRRHPGSLAGCSQQIFDSTENGTLEAGKTN